MLPALTEKHIERYEANKKKNAAQWRPVDASAGGPGMDAAVQKTEESKTIPQGDRYLEGWFWSDVI